MTSGDTPPRSRDDATAQIVANAIVIKFKHAGEAAARQEASKFFEQSMSALLRQKLAPCYWGLLPDATDDERAAVHLANEDSREDRVIIEALVQDYLSANIEEIKTEDTDLDIFLQTLAAGGEVALTAFTKYVWESRTRGEDRYPKMLAHFNLMPERDRMSMIDQLVQMAMGYAEAESNPKTCQR